MDVRFRTTFLERCYADERVRNRHFGKKAVARRFVQRIEELRAAYAGPDLAKLPQLRFHEPKGDKQGTFAIDIDHSWRIELRFDDERRQKVVVLEASKHYGD